jgi:cytosol alanyl aminopeptidase
MHSGRGIALSIVIASSVSACAAPGTPTPAAGPVRRVDSTSIPPTAAADPHPALRLPGDVHPTAEAIELTIDPENDGFTGRADIDVALTQPRQSVWLHARGLHISSASVTPDGSAPLAATWADEDDRGLGRLEMTSSAPAGRARIHVEYGASYTAGTQGLFRTKQAGVAYAFTQFEAIDARRAFPCFDEPSFKIPFTVTLDVPKGDEAVANTLEVGRTAADGGVVRVSFAPTRPLPSYLVAFAVGPLDVVKGPDVPPNAVRTRPLPLRGVTTKGRGPELAYALGHVGEILSALEGYFGIEYPYEKMDVLAVPDMGGAMENAGAVTFQEDLLLFDPKTAPVHQRQAFAEVVAHEFAHQWFGDLVTMAWWDDTWLNESFAEWMGVKIADRWDPTLHSDLELAGGMQEAIGSDSLINARQIHQPIASSDDIENSFDDATYEKGGSVIAMFERWLGADVFQRGVRQHLTQHRFGNATVDDFLGALSAAAGRDIATPYRTFLDQPGVPYIEAAVQCWGGHPRVHLKQSRFLPLGSTGDASKLWQVPVCARYATDGGATKEACTLLTTVDGDLPLEGNACPTWVFPNARGLGYYRFSLASADLANVRTRAIASLDTRERMALGNSLRAAFSHGTTPFGEVLQVAMTLASDPDRHVAEEPADLVETAHEWLHADPVRPRIEAFARKLMNPQLAKLGWTKHSGEADTAMDLRSQVLSFMADVGQHPGVRAEARRRAAAYIGFGKDGAIHRDAVDENLAGTALSVAGEEADAPMLDALIASFVKAQDDELRTLLGGLSRVRDSVLSQRVLSLVLDDRVKYTEMLRPLWAQFSAPETREAAWTWLKEHWDAVSTRTSAAMFSGVQLLAIPAAFCDEAHAQDVAAFLTDRAAKVDGGRRVLAKTLEEIRLCTARRGAAEADARRFFASH